jgi:SAM-dependent methyltransferase
MRRRLLVSALFVVALNSCGAQDQSAREPRAENPSHAAPHGGACHGDAHAGAYEHRFEKAEDWAKRFDDPMRDLWQKPELVVEAMKMGPEMVVADIGAGTGYFLPHLAKTAARVIGLDIEPDMVRYMNERIAREKLEGTSARECKADDPGLTPASVDRILIVDTWHHIGDRGEYSKRLKAALREGGAVYVVDFKLDAPMGPPKDHRLTPEQAIAELQAGGLAAETVEVDLPYQWVVRGWVQP